MKRYAELCALAAMVLGLAACAGGPAPRPHPPAPPPAPKAAAVQAPAAGKAEQRYQEALALLKNGQRKPAQDILLVLTREQPELSGPWTTLGISQAQGQQRDAAIASFTRAVAANPRNAMAYNWLGSLYRESGNLVASEQAYLKALASQPDYAVAHLNLAILYDVSMKRPQQALSYYRSYQQFKGGENLIVSAWIKELEAAQPPPVSVAGVQP
ncbi:tetratricopeptide repeat protein [Solimonas sp. SE-A11]|uniref:tetratricopeptide repeat protein n=1 Tax=Solimonas sp. SE-A11 TaxID=3054954 RepID=UPI00259C6BA4|nr:tetratricopeptide repeat protein [Solimonas sp. SE-A11]MDM4768733.1 tetratricopeptide repeat protein [Solimonas sp. SE-A11]